MHAGHAAPRLPAAATPIVDATQTRHPSLLQQDAFADDTVRMIKQLRAANPQIQASLVSKSCFSQQELLNA